MPRAKIRTLHIELEDHESCYKAVQVRWNGRSRTLEDLLPVAWLPPLVDRQTPIRTDQGSKKIVPFGRLASQNLKLNKWETIIELLTPLRSN